MRFAGKSKRRKEGESGWSMRKIPRRSEIIRFVGEKKKDVWEHKKRSHPTDDFHLVARTGIEPMILP